MERGVDPIRGGQTGEAAAGALPAGFPDERQFRHANGKSRKSCSMPAHRPSPPRGRTQSRRCILMKRWGGSAAWRAWPRERDRRVIREPCHRVVHRPQRERANQVRLRSERDVFRPDTPHGCAHVIVKLAEMGPEEGRSPVRASADIYANLDVLRTTTACCMHVLQPTRPHAAIGY